VNRLDKHFKTKVSIPRIRRGSKQELDADGGRGIALRQVFEKREANMDSQNCMSDIR
jgi:hypothetical protein